jgi:hypothetical protein
MGFTCQTYKNNRCSQVLGLDEITYLYKLPCANLSESGTYLEFWDGWGEWVLTCFYVKIWKKFL